MNDRNPVRQADLDSLRADYRHAFENWAARTGRLHDDQDAAGQSESTVEEQAGAAAAETDYRSARDRLAAEMMHGAHDPDR